MFEARLQGKTSWFEADTQDQLAYDIAEHVVDLEGVHAYLPMIAEANYRTDDEDRALSAVEYGVLNDKMCKAFAEMISNLKAEIQHEREERIYG